MLNNLSDKLQDIFKKVRGHGKLSETNIKDALREVRLSLLEADVNYTVTKNFVKTVMEKCMGEDVLKGINPGQQFIKIVHDELVEILGGGSAGLSKAAKAPTVILLAGLQGAGKTTFAAKLSNYLRKKGEKTFLVAADVYRPAAQEQLKVLGKSINTTVFTIDGCKDVVKIFNEAKIAAEEERATTIIVDTAGRLHIDSELMQELVELKKVAKPQEILLVVDAMTGQDAVNVAKEFNETLAIDGVVLTKLDGDTRGGAALSIKSVVGKPIKFASVGEKMADVEAFHPARMASRILGMGDVVSLVEKAQEAIDQDEMARMEERMRKSQFSLEDFLSSLQQMKKMGPLGGLLKMIPGMPKIDDLAPAEKEMKKVEAIIQSMTVKERQHPDILNANRKKRIAKGSGTQVSDVNKLLKQFEQMKDMMKMFNGMKGGKMPKMPNLGALKNMKMPF